MVSTVPVWLFKNFCYVHDRCKVLYLRTLDINKETVLTLT